VAHGHRVVCELSGAPAALRERNDVGGHDFTLSYRQSVTKKWRPSVRIVDGNVSRFETGAMHW
jgi:hypothetical protein